MEPGVVVTQLERGRRAFVRAGNESGLPVRMSNVALVLMLELLDGASRIDYWCTSCAAGDVPRHRFCHRDPVSLQIGDCAMV